MTAQPVRKCLVWDLDNTLWDGICIEGSVSVSPGVFGAVAELDRRGVLQSIASRGDEETALQTLRRFDLADYFLVPQINWLPKSQNISRIARELNVSLDSIAFIDDDAFEREQVVYMLPSVLTLPAEEAPKLSHRAEFSPKQTTQEAMARRHLYKAEMERQHAEESFSSREEFLASCAMRLSVRKMQEQDIPRIAELMSRTHQLNTTGLLLERNDLDAFLHSGENCRQVFIAELVDKFGTYGIIGTAIVEFTDNRIWLKYLALSCRVMGRGIERAFLSTLVHSAVHSTVTSVAAEFCDTGKNKMMRAMYQMMGFRPAGNTGNDGCVTFRADRRDVPRGPSWIEVT